jgi:hypothetical protein
MSAAALSEAREAPSSRSETMCDPRRLDLRHINLESAGLYAAARKATALAEARRRGWTPDSVRQASNRFNRFWILGQWVEYGQQLRCAREDGGTVLITLKQKEPSP